MITPRFTVIWRPDVERDLTEYWLAVDSAERERLTRVIDVVDRQLSIAPGRVGKAEDADPDSRIWDIDEVPPTVRVAYKVLPDDRLVRVIRLTLYGRRID